MVNKRKKVKEFVKIKALIYNIYLYFELGNLVW